MDYEAHPLSLAFPDMAPEQFRRLSEDIKRNGLIHTIVLFEGKILDGRHRYRACIETGINPRFTHFRDGDADESCGGDPIAFVQSENAARRQLTESQIAFAMTHPNILEFEQRKARERQVQLGRSHGEPLGPDSEQGSEKGRTAHRLATKAGVGHSTISAAIKVRKQGTDEVKQAVESGEVSLNMAEKIVKLNPAAQKKIIEAPARSRPHELRSALVRSDSATRRANRGSAVTAPAEPATSFVRKFLSGLERMTMMCAEDGALTGSDIASRFLAEMDWDAPALTAQLDRADPLVRALAIIQQRVAKAA